LVLAACPVLPIEANGTTIPLPGHPPAPPQSSSPEPNAPPASASLSPTVQAHLDKLTAALNEAHAAGDAKAEARTLSEIGYLYFSIGEKQKTLDCFNQALTLRRGVNDRSGQAGALNDIGVVYKDLDERQKALDSYNQAIAIRREIGDRSGEAGTIYNVGRVYYELEEHQKALEYFHQALAIQRDLGEHGNEAGTLNGIGNVYISLGNKQKALEYYMQALAVQHTLGNRKAEAASLNNISTAYGDLGDQRKALEYGDQALGIERDLGDHAGEARTQNNIGSAYLAVGEKQKALEHFMGALEVLRSLKDRGGEAATLNNIGVTYDRLGEPQKTIGYENQALAVYVQLGDRRGAAGTLSNIGNAYDTLGEERSALDQYDQALARYRSVGDRAGEAMTLGNICFIYLATGDRQKGLEYCNKSLPMERELDDRAAEARTLNHMGLAYAGSLERQKALEYFNQSLQIEREVVDRADEADTLNNIALEYDGLGEKQKALEFYKQAMQLATEANEPIEKASIFYNLMRAQKTQQPALAIFYGKQAVNLLQQVRGNIQELDKNLQKSFLSSKHNYYRDLADLLIAQGRLPEAEQVMDLERQQEYSDYVRGEATSTLSPVTLTRAELEADEQYQKSTAQIVSLGEQWSQLSKNTARTPEQQKQFDDLSAQLSKASAGLDVFYSRLYVLFGKVNRANNQVDAVQGNVSSLKQTLGKMPHTVALYTLVGADQTSIIVITGSAKVTAVVRVSAISEMELNQKIAAFQEVLRHPGQDPKPRAQELYEILIGPVKADLDQAKAETLVWSLDGALRYVPIAALYDGKQYVVENYNIATISPASIAHLAAAPDMSNISTVAMGISQKYEEGLNALPAVVGELDDVVKDAKVQGANGALTGTILLNGQFTRKAMENEFGADPTVVHIASHFVYKSGDAGKSYLLLAGKDKEGPPDHLTVEEFHNDVNLKLTETALLTLSACDTGKSGSEDNGKEVDGLGMTAELNGAKAVISSLWSVNDASTGQLMGDFYKRWAEGAGKVEKVEALRQAQLDLLLGVARVQGDGSKRGLGVDKSDDKSTVNYAHPYYWAPFVLMGNWK
jgi:CHAT domain-containing protein